MGLFSEKRNYDTHFAPVVDPAKAVPYRKGWKESFKDEWNYQTYANNSYSRTDNLHDEFAKDIENIEKATGTKLKNPYNSAFEEFFVEDVALGFWDTLTTFNPYNSRFHPENQKKREENNLKEYYQKANKLKEKYPGLEFRDIETIKADIKKQAHFYHQKVNDGREANAFSSFAGSAAGSMTDPLNAITSLISLPANAAKTTVMKALGKTALREFLANAGVEALIQPSVYQYKKELDLPHSVGESVGNVMAAGIGGAVLGAGAKALHIGGRAVLNRFREAQAKGIKFDGAAIDAADVLEQKLDFDDFVSRSNPLDDNITGHKLHERAIYEEMLRLTDETGQMAKAYDKVLATPQGAADEVLAEITPEYMEKVWVNRGGFKKFNEVKGSGFGMVKFIFKHGEKGSDAVKITKDDVIAFPRVIREYEPIQLDQYGNHRIWSVKRADGTQIVYSDGRFVEDGQRHLVTIHTMTEDKNQLKGIFSEKRRRTRPAVHTKDTAQKTFSRTEGSSAEASAPKSRFQGGGGAFDADSIMPEGAKVKDFEYLDNDRLAAELENRPALLPEDKKTDMEFVGQMRQEDAWDNEILNCIMEFGKK